MMMEENRAASPSPLAPRMTTEPAVVTLLRYASPCGTLVLGSLGDKLCMCDWLVPGHHERIVSRLRRTLHAEFREQAAAEMQSDAEFREQASHVMLQAAAQLDEYFEGRRKTFSVPLLFVGTDFQQRVWRVLLTIPYGHTLTYAQLADRIGQPRAVRAVASACGANALSLFAPCHRVIGSNHTLTGYAGGLNAKRRLLMAEKCM